MRSTNDAGALNRESHAVPRHGVLRNFIDISGGAVVGSALALWATAHLARVLGVAGFGELSLARTVFEYAVLAVTFGLTVVGTRDIAAAPSRVSEVAYRVTGVRFIFSLGVALLMLISSVWVSTVLVAVSLRWLVLGVILSALTIDWVYSARENVRTAAAARLAGRVVYSIVVLTAVRSLVDFENAVFAIILETLVVASVAWIGFKHVRPRWNGLFGSQEIRRLLSSSGRIGLAQLARQLKTNVDVFILVLLSGSVAVGYYSAAYRMVMFVGMIAGLLATVLLPRIVRAFQVGDELNVLAAQVLRIVLLAMAAICGGGVPLAAPLIRLLFGAEFGPAGKVMIILVPAMALLVMSAVLTNFAIGVGKEGVFVRAALGSAVLNVCANLVLVPAFGMYGAAVATVLTESLLVILLLRSIRNLGLRGSIPLSWLFRLAVVAGIQALATVIVLRLGMGVGVACIVSVLSFLAAGISLRIVSLSEIRELLAVAFGK